MDPFFLILLVFLVVMIVMSNRTRKKQAQQRQQLETGLQPGTGVMTIGGFYGRVVDVDGDVVTLESPSGVETIWSKTAIRQITEPPFAPVEEADETDGVVDVVEETPDVDGPRPGERGDDDKPAGPTIH